MIGKKKKKKTERKEGSWNIFSFFFPSSPFKYRRNYRVLWWTMLFVYYSTKKLPLV